MVEKEHLIDLKNISKEFDGFTVLDNINLNKRKKEFVTAKQRVVALFGSGDVCNLFIIQHLCRYLRFCVLGLPVFQQFLPLRPLWVQC